MGLGQAGKIRVSKFALHTFFFEDASSALTRRFLMVNGQMRFRWRTAKSGEQFFAEGFRPIIPSAADRLVTAIILMRSKFFEIFFQPTPAFAGISSAMFP